MTIREQIILAACGYLLAGAASPSLYSSSSAGPAPVPGLAVHRERTRPLEADRLPAVLLYSEDEEPSPIGSRRDAPLTERALTLKVECRAQGSQTTPPDAALDPVIAWVLWQILNNEKFGGLANGVSEGKTSWTSKEGDTVLAAAAIHFTVKYRTSRTDPSSSH